MRDSYFDESWHDNLRKLESKGFFRQGGMSLRNPDDPNSFKVRRGKVGGFSDYFEAQEATELEEYMVANLSPTFGYGATAKAGQIQVDDSPSQGSG